MRKLFFSLLAVVMVLPAMAQKKWTVDPAHTFVNFKVGHLGISVVEGSFKSFDGHITSSKSDFADASVEFKIETGSVSTGVSMRDDHLKSDDFLNAEKYPEMKFKSTVFRKTSGRNYDLHGELTIRDVTKLVKFTVTYGGTTKDMQGREVAGFEAVTTINRFDFNINFDPGGKTVAKDVEIRLNLEVKADQ